MSLTSISTISELAALPENTILTPYSFECKFDMPDELTSFLEELTKLENHFINLTILPVSGLSQNHFKSIPVFLFSDQLNLVSVTSRLFIYTTDTSFMFADCQNLRWIDCLFTSSTKGIEMFRNCYSLESVNMSMFSSSLKEISYMFTNCKSLSFISNASRLITTSYFSGAFHNDSWVRNKLYFCSKSSSSSLKNFLVANKDDLDMSERDIYIAEKDVITNTIYNFSHTLNEDDSANYTVPAESEEYFYNILAVNNNDYLNGRDYLIKVSLDYTSEISSWGVPATPATFVCSDIEYSSASYDAYIPKNVSFDYSYSKLPNFITKIDKAPTLPITIVQPPKIYQTSVKSLDSAFTRTAIKTMPRLPETIESINNAFSYTKIEKVLITYEDHNSLTDITLAFAYSSVKEAYFPGSNILKAERAFANTPIEHSDFNLPMEANAKDMFANCPNLFYLNFDPVYVDLLKGRQDVIEITRSKGNSYNLTIHVLNGNEYVTSFSCPISINGNVSFLGHSQELTVDTSIPLTSIKNIIKSGYRFGPFDNGYENRLIVLAKDPSKITTNLISVSDAELDEIVK